VKGVDFRFLKAVSAQNLALFGFVLVGAMVFVGETGYVSVLRRRREFGVLRGLGWRAPSIACLVEFEMLLLGVGADSSPSLQGYRSSRASAWARPIGSSLPLSRWR
jgi:hypothetical protein